MSLQAVIDSVANAIRDESGVDQVLTEQPNKLPDDRCFIVLPIPGDVKFMTNSGALRNVDYAAEDDIFIEFAIKSARDAVWESEPETRRMVVQLRNTIISAMQRNRLASVHAFRGFSFPLYGPLEFWKPDVAFGFNAVLSITHGVNVTAGNAS